MSAIARTIWFIESRFREEVSLDDLARATGLSPSYLSRMFTMGTGYTVSAYLRGRRLTEAARALADGAPDILSVALDAGYGSHEAFTRAFRDQFGLTPDAVRRRQSLKDLNLVEAMKMEAATKVQLDPPVIERRAPMRMAGLAGHFNLDNPAGIPDQWQKFNALAGEVRGITVDGAFGVVGEMSDGGFDYMSAFAVSDTADLPREFTAVKVQARRWARFTHKGHISGIRATCAAIYGEWLPGSGAEQAEDVSFLEYYGPDFDPRTGLGTVEIWIGLKD
jgi:AraC family transcriptional regulator